MDMLLTAGERVSMALLSMALAAQGVPAISLTGSQSGIITDGTHGRARIRRVLGTRIREGIAQGKVVIVAGFQGVSEQKEITTLGRGGSDTTAVALAAALGAEACEIYTDVDGVFSADPRRVPSARHWPEVPASLMLELAERGAGVLHPRCVEIARQFGVDLRVINSLREGTEKGTRVVKDQDTERLEEFRVLGVTCDEGKVPLMIELARPTALAALWDRAGSLPVVAPQFQAGQVMFFTDRDCEEEWAKRLSTLATDGFVRTYRFDLDQTPVSVVGTQFSQDSGALQNLIEILAQAEIPVTMGSVSALAATLAVPRSRAEEAVQLLHGKYFKPT
jgi:aspartate kinase